MAAQIGRQIVPFPHGNLTGFVLRPAIEVRFAIFHRHPLFFRRDCIDTIAPLIVSIDLFRQLAVVILIRMNDHFRRQTGRGKTRMRGMAQAHAGNGENILGQVGDFGNTVNMVTDHTDWAATQPGGFGGGNEILHSQGRIDGGVQKGIQMIVGKLVFAKLAQFANAPGIATKQQEYRAGTDPAHFRHQFSNGAPLARILYPDDGALLQIRLGRRRERTGIQQIQGFLGDRIIQKSTMGTVRQQRCQNFISRPRVDFRHVKFHAKSFCRKIRQFAHNPYSIMLSMPIHLKPFAAVLCCLVALAACAPRVQDFQPGLMAAKIQDDNFVSEDGKVLPLRVWPARDGPRAVLVALHGFNMYSAYFAEPATWWAGHGIITYAYDQRGFGAAPDARIWGGASAMASDVRALLALLAKRHPGLPIYLLGESMGAAVAILAMTGSPAGAPRAEAAGVILVAPGLWGGQSMHPILRFGLWLSAHTMPWNTATGSGLKRRASDNVDMLRALGRDKLIIRRTRVDAIYGVTQLMGRAFDAAPGLQQPALILYGERDEIVPAAPIHQSIARLPKPPEFVLYPEGWHMLLRDLQAEVVWGDIAAWIQDPAAALPSRARQLSR